MDGQKDQQTNHTPVGHEIINIKNEPISDCIEFENNPWNVESLQAFLCLKCPQCVFDTKEKDVFENHAIENHPLSIVLFGRTFKEETNVDKEFNFQGNFLADDINFEDPLQEGEPDYIDYCESKLEPNIKIEEELMADHQNPKQGFSNKNGLTSKSKKKRIYKRPFTCDLCGLSFVKKARWKAHIDRKYSCKSRIDKNNERNTLERKINRPCPVCDEVSESYDSKVRHIAEKHPERKIYNCLFCEKKFLSIKYFHMHLSQKHEEEHGPDIYNSLPVPKGSRRKCPICKRVFKSRTIVMEHYALAHPEAQIYNCSLCEQRYPTLSGLNSHIFKSHERKLSDLVCLFCGKDFTLKQELEDHIATDHKEKKYECSKCEASFRGHIALITHIEKVHERKKHQCSTCGEVFESMMRLESHIAQKHDRTKLFQCPSCNASYISKKALDGHISFVHDKSTGHLCPECGENFKEKRGMKDHILAVHEGKRFDCQFCNKTFHSILTMQSHIRNIHEGRKPKPEKCSLCDKIFVNKGTLRKHTEAVHEKKRPYACHLCDLSFTQSGNLKTHIKGKHKEFIFTGKIKNGSFLPG